MSSVKSFLPNPIYIVRVLRDSPFQYPGGRQDRGFKDVKVIPSLWSYMYEIERFPHPEEGKNFLQELADQNELRRHETEVTRRAEKLYFDFAREMHTFRLLMDEDSFASVKYKEELDFSNTDFAVGLSEYHWSIEEPKKILVQSQMRHSKKWENARPGETTDNRVKEKRRKKRGEEEITGKKYYIHNKYIEPAHKPSGCWLFGPAHIGELVKSIAMDYNYKGEDNGG